MRTRAQVEVGITAAGGALQGSVLGYGLGMMNKSLEAQAATMPNKPPMAAQGSFSGPPKVLALNLARSLRLSWSQSSEKISSLAQSRNSGSSGNVSVTI